jgi:hypothetical protein
MRTSLHGRWSGALTSRPLPEHDDAIDVLEDADRRDLAIVWRARAASELRVARSFQVMTGALDTLAAPRELQDLAARGIDDEHRHAQICVTVAARFAGHDIEPPDELPFAPPVLDAPAPLRHVLAVVGHCALNETTASAFLEAALAEASGALARAALRELLADEVDHGRIGWALLATLPPALRAELAPWLLPLVRANLRAWRQTPRFTLDRPAFAAHGAPSGATVERALRTAIEQLIVPGFARMGLPIAAIVRWSHAGMDGPSLPCSSPVLPL